MSVILLTLNQSIIIMIYPSSHPESTTCDIEDPCDKLLYFLPKSTYEYVYCVIFTIHKYPGTIPIGSFPCHPFQKVAS